MRHIYSEKLFEPYKALFKKLEGFNLLVSEDNENFNNLAVFGFGSICDEKGELKETQTSTWF